MISGTNTAYSGVRVAPSASGGIYASIPPFHPESPCAEYPFRLANVGAVNNPAYNGVRQVFQFLELDADNCDKADWNPLGAMLNPGQTVVLKPNFVREFRETHEGHGDCLITHGSVIRAVLDYVYIALKGEGRIIVADAPQNDADFDAICRIAGLREIQEFYRREADFDIEVYDLRPQKARKVDGVIVGHESLPGDPAGYVKVDLGKHSMFAEVEHLCHLLYGSEYDTREIRSHHTGGVHEYMISKTILDADCVINLPKLKTHKKTGMTCCMKNLVGINGNKNWLPHHREGTPSQGGDQYADDGFVHRIESASMGCFRRVFPLLGPVRNIVAGPVKYVGKRVFGDTNTNTIRSGNWYGNDTTWRMVIDLNRIFLYADSSGRIKDSPQRNTISIVDGIIGGEGNGPLDPTPKNAGLIVAGFNPVAVDMACAQLMGFDWRRLPVLVKSYSEHVLPLAKFEVGDVICYLPEGDTRRCVDLAADNDTRFRPHFGWVGQVEHEQARESAVSG